MAAETHRSVAESLERTPIIGVVRTGDRAEAEAQARELIAAGVELVEITFSCPDATEIVTELLAERGPEGPPWIGMGTVTRADRARRALAAGAEFIVTPNANAETAAVATEAGVFLVVGALTPTEIVAAREMGADYVKVYPLAPVGGPAYLATVRQPLSDVPCLAAGGFPPGEIPAYRQAGARAYGIAAPLLGAGGDGGVDAVRRAIGLARGEEPA